MARSYVFLSEADTSICQTLTRAVGKAGKISNDRRLCIHVKVASFLRTFESYPLVRRRLVEGLDRPEINRPVRLGMMRNHRKIESVRFMVPRL